MHILLTPSTIHTIYARTHTLERTRDGGGGRFADALRTGVALFVRAACLCWVRFDVALESEQVRERTRRVMNANAHWRTCAAQTMRPVRHSHKKEPVGNVEKGVECKHVGHAIT